MGRLSEGQDAAKRQEPRIAFKRYGTNRRWATSAGRSVFVRLGRFYLFIDFGRMLNGKP